LRPRRVFLEVQMEHLADAVLRLDVVPAVGLRPVDELELPAFAHPRHGAQALELILEAVLPLDAAHEHAVFLAVVVGLRPAGFLFDFSFHHHNLSPDSSLTSISCWNSGGPKPNRSPCCS